MHLLLPNIILYFTLIFQTHGIRYKDIAKLDSPDTGGNQSKKASKSTNFKKWKEWENNFPNCNPINNEFLSPINIDTSMVVLDFGQTLIVYSGSPIGAGGYTFNNRFQHEGKVAMDIAVIGVRGAKSRDATHISGLGSRELRYFHKAIFLGSFSEVEPERSLHQINGKKFPMEIVLYFKDIRNEETSHVHVMVQEGETDNPAFHWLLDILTDGFDTSQGRDDNENIVAAQKAYLEADLNARTIVEKESEEMDGDLYAMAYEDLKLLYSKVKDSDESRIHALEMQRKNLTEEMSKIQNATGKVSDEKNGLKAKLKAAQNVVRNQIAQGVLLPSQENDDTDKVKALQSQLQKVSDKFNALMVSYNGKSQAQMQVDKSLRSLARALKQFKIGKMEGAVFPSIKAVKDELDSVETKMKSKDQILELLVQKRDKLEEALAGQTHDIPLELNKTDAYFQISWLLPPTGGFYSYKGSSMIPPCSPQTHSIVMERPINISRKQFVKLFAKIPYTRTKKEIEAGEPITYFDKMIPPLRDLGKRVVSYNRRNLLFRTDDGLHMKSMMRRKIKDELEKSCAITQSYISTILIYILPLIVIDYFNYYN